LEIPEDLATQLTPEHQDLARAVLEAVALEGYRSGKLTEAELRRLLGYESRLELDGFLKEHGVYLEYTMEDLERESATGDKLWQKRRQEPDGEAEPRRRAG